MDKGLEQTFLQRRYADNDMLNVTNHQGNTNQNYKRYNLTPNRMAIMKNKNNQCWQGYG